MVDPPNYGWAARVGSPGAFRTLRRQRVFFSIVLMICIFTLSRSIFLVCQLMRSFHFPFVPLVPYPRR